MIELKISAATAANLLMQKMKEELRDRKFKGFYPYYYELYTMPSDDLHNITETAIFDLIILLPAEIFLKENNLALIIESAIRALAKELNREQLILFNIKNADKIVNSICRLFIKAEENKSYLNN